MREADALEVADDLAGLPREEVHRLVERLEREMRLAATELRFEEAALIRDEIAELRRILVEEPA